MLVRVNITLQPDTLNRLDQYASENHCSRSQALTQLIWRAQVKNPQARGQMSMDEFTDQKSKPRKRK